MRKSRSDFRVIIGGELLTQRIVILLIFDNNKSNQH
jgi:hypothetical protein